MKKLLLNVDVCPIFFHVCECVYLFYHVLLASQILHRDNILYFNI